MTLRGFVTRVFSGKTFERASNKKITAKRERVQRRRALFLEGLEARQLLAAFTPGNLAVYRVGDGSSTLASTGNTVFVDEYTPAGVLVQSIAMPSSGTSVKLIASGVAPDEGMLTLSPDGTQLALTGYNSAPTPTTALSGTSTSVIQRSVALLDPAGGSSLYSFSSDFANFSRPTSAIVDGGKLYLAGGGSVHYVNANALTPGSTGNSSLSLYSLSFGPARGLKVADGQLYTSFAFGNFPIGKIGTGEPTTSGQPIGSLPGLVSGGAATQFYFADLSPTIGIDSASPTLGSDTLYIADEGVPALRKYSYSGTTWVAKGTIGTDSDDYRGLTGVVNGGTVTLYATRKGGVSSSAQGGGELVSLVDASGYDGTLSGTPTLLASAITGTRNNTAFRGVALVPAASNQPPGFTASGPFSVDENSAAGTLVGAVTATDPNLGQVLAFSEIGTGTGANLFEIDANGAIRVSAGAALDFEGTNSYSFDVRVTDNGSPAEHADITVTIQLTNVNEAPTALSLAGNSIVEKEPIGVVVGTFSGVDPDAADSLSYSLVDGAGSEGNASFSIAGGVLQTAAILDYQAQHQYSIRVRASDLQGLFFEQSFTIDVSDVRLSGITGAPAVTYRENAAAALISSAGVVLDVQLLDFNGGALTVGFSANGTVDDRLSIKHTGNGAGQIGVDYNTQTVRYGGVPVATYAGGMGASPLVITFNSAAFKAAVQGVLRAITFANVSDSPSILARSISFVLTDGDGGTSNTQLRTVNVTAVNDLPVITVTGSSVTYQEGGAKVVIDSGVAISDVDSGDFSSGKLTVKAATGGQSTDRFGIDASGLISVTGTTVNYDEIPIGSFAGTTTLIVTLNGNATPLRAAELARHIVFWSIAGAPSPTPRGISFRISDGDGGTSPAALGDTVNIELVNDAPVLTLTNTISAKYTENVVGLLIASSATVVDVDLLNFDTGTLSATLTGNGAAADQLSIRHTGNAAGQVGVDYNAQTIAYGGVLVASYSGGDGVIPLVITFNTSALKTEVQAVMRAITFANSSDNPSTAQRTVSFVLTDGDGGTSNTVVRSIDVIAKNDAPVVANFGAAVDYTLTGAPTLLTDSAMVSDGDSADFNGGKLTVALTTNRSSLDRIEIEEGNDISVNGSTVSYLGNAIGNFTGTTTLTFTLNSAFATPDAVQALLRQLTFRTTSSSTATRTVTVSLTDGDGGTSVLVNKSINVHSPMV